MATLYTNSAGQIFTLGGKLVQVSGLNIYTTQTLNMPSGDQLVVSVGEQSSVLYITSDLDLDFIWTGSEGEYYHWSVDVNSAYLTGGSMLHIFEFNHYDWEHDDNREWLNSRGDPTAEAYFIRDHGRYLGTIWIENDQWRVENFRPV